MNYTEHPKCCMTHHFQNKNSCTCRCHHGLTNEELLAKLDDLAVHNSGYGAISEALCAIVKLHKPDKEGLCAMNCVEVDDDGYAWTQVAYPCLTIQAITKELQ